MLENITDMIVLRMESFADSLDDWLHAHLLNILIILVGAWILRRVATELARRLLKHIVRPDVYPTKSDREKRIKTLSSLASGIIRLGVYLMAGLMIISEVRPDYKAILFTSAGLIGAVIGFGAQNLIKDLVSGIFIIIENQYRIGDEISLVGGAGVGEVSGVVEDITIRTTVLRDLSGNVHHMPNGNIGVTTNKTLGYSRMNEDIIVAADTDLDKLAKVIEEVGKELTKVSELENKVIEPPYMASIKGLSGEGISVRVLAKTSPAAQWKTRSEFYRKLKAKNVDTTTYDSQVAELKTMVTTYETDLAKYKEAVSDLQELDCTSNPDGFKAALEAARTALGKVNTDGQAIKSYLSKTIKPTLKTIHDQLAATNSESGGN